jgi:AcrR family transcriptional regulator
VREARARQQKPSTRRYRGVTASERRAQRRERLLEAGLELFGTRGYARTPVRKVCAEASLNSRYFYESFESNEDLLFQLYERIVTEVVAAVIEATAGGRTIEEQARSGLLAAWDIMVRDPRKARVVGVEVVGASERLDRLRRRNRHLLADILTNNALSLVGPDVELRFDPVLNARAMIGASGELMLDWVNGELGASVPEIVDYLVHLYTTTADAIEARPRGGRGRTRRSRGTRGGGAGGGSGGSGRGSGGSGTGREGAPRAGAGARGRGRRRGRDDAGRG